MPDASGIGLPEVTAVRDRAENRPHRREALLACLLGVALFVVPMAIDLAR